MRLKELLLWASAQFDKANLSYGHGTDNSWDEAVSIVRYVLRLPITVEANILSRRLTNNEQAAIVKLIKRRIDGRIPVAYLTHEAWFAGLKFYVDERVIIPRSPIAELIEKRFHPWINKNRVNTILDLCTGSGCIAIASARYFPNATVDAVDISTAALDVAKINVKQHSLQDRVKLLHGDLFAPLINRKYDLIISNPPYIKDSDLIGFPDEYSYEPELAFKAGDDGLDVVERILQQAKDHLTDNGMLIVELGNGAHELEKRHPELPFIWLEFERGGEGVFLLDKA